MVRNGGSTARRATFTKRNKTVPTANASTTSPTIATAFRESSVPPLANPASLDFSVVSVRSAGAALGVFTLGALLGPILGTKLGDSLGTTVGSSLGKELGEALGETLGETLGNTLGNTVGS
jgi:hypothetical protein